MTSHDVERKFGSTEYLDGQTEFEVASKDTVGTFHRFAGSPQRDLRISISNIVFREHQQFFLSCCPVVVWSHAESDNLVPRYLQGYQSLALNCLRERDLRRGK